MIKMENVQREYPTLHGRVRVLRDVNFIIRPGEKVGIIGKNGAGKSTMIRLISGSEKPNSGRSEEHTSELQSLMRISYAVFCLKKKKETTQDKLRQMNKTN